MFKSEDFTALNSMKEVQQMSWKDFEWFCKFFLEALGYERVSVTPPKYDGGVDNIAFKDGEKYCVQDKHWDKNGSKKKNHIPVETVRALEGSMKQKNATRGIIIATVPAHTTAKKEAKALNIEIIDLDKLKQLLKEIKPNFDDTEYKREPRPVQRFFITRKEIVRLRWGLVVIMVSFVWLAVKAYS
jgi:HJR/Mrr/RecB family endonuclease